MEFLQREGAGSAESAPSLFIVFSLPTQAIRQE